MSEPDSDRILVKKDNLARCAWCGTPESDEWITTQRNEIFCSSECQSAKYAYIPDNRDRLITYLFASLGVGTLLAPILYNYLNPSFYGDPKIIADMFAFGIMCLIVSAAPMLCIGEGAAYQDRKDKYRDISLLVCEYCTQTNPPNVTRCRYCGASLTKAPFSYVTTPPWIQKKRLNRLRCPRCASVYSYNSSSLRSDGTVKCQNCNEPFVPSRPLAQTYESDSARSLYSDV